MPSTITLRVPEGINAALDNMSEATGKPVGVLVRDAIEQWLASKDSEELMQELTAARARRDEAARRAMEEVAARRLASGQSEM